MDNAFKEEPKFNYGLLEEKSKYAKNEVWIDEAQDMNWDFIPVIEGVLSPAGPSSLEHREGL